MKTKSHSQSFDEAHSVSNDQRNVTPSAAADDSDSNTAFLGSSTVAHLLEVTPATLRNYVWLQSLTLKERQRRHLQSPPAKMPKPKRIRGRLHWNAQIFKKWLAERVQ